MFGIDLYGKKYPVDNSFYPKNLSYDPISLIVSSGSIKKLILIEVIS